MDLKTFKLPYWDHINLALELKSTWTTLLDLDSFYDNLYLNRKKLELCYWTLDLDWLT